MKEWKKPEVSKSSRDALIEMRKNEIMEIDGGWIALNFVGMCFGIGVGGDWVDAPNILGAGVCVVVGHTSISFL